MPTATATSLRLELNPLPSLAAVAAALLRGVDEELEHLGDMTYALATYSKLTVHAVGERLRCRLGGRGIDGTFVGFDPQGFLRILIEGREEVLAAGEILE